MNKGLLKTEIGSELWGRDVYTIELPLLYVGDQIHLSFTISEFSKIHGLFDVEDTLHVYSSVTGYVQRVKVKPSN